MMEDELHLFENHLTAFSSELTSPSSIKTNSYAGVQLTPGQSKYAQLLAVIEEIGRDLRPAYSGSRSSAERLKRGIVHARILVRECLIETERSARQMAQFIKKNIFNTELNADSVEWCPIKNYRNFFICGTYQLSKSENLKDAKKKNPKELRKGHLYLFQLVQEPEIFKLVERIAMVGILDCKWAHRQIANNIFLAVATALGDVRIFKLQDESAVSLKHVCTHKLSSSKTTVALSLDWSTGLNESDVKIVISDSEGFITLVSFADGQICEDCKWKLHDFHAWIVAFNYWNTNIFYSGGDDCQLFIYDRRSDKVGKNDKVHTAGITSMQMNLKREHSLISGSYDEKVAFWDVRQMKLPKNLLSAGGGVWRLKWEPNECSDLAAACMHNGFLAIDGKNCSIIAEYKEHSSLAYGIDWSSLEQREISDYFDIETFGDKKLHVLSMCSFYDNLLSIAILQK